ncbi:hypothetical protein BC835DRAFT_1390667 [Cytidiella melzeri]|nr:hypothetical protein BC835DRAFT_1390667 [Cytidiella melzeri]
MAYSSVANIQAELIGTFIEILIYSIYLVVFCRCLQVLRVKYTEGRPTSFMACTALAIFVLVSIHAIMVILRAINAFTTHADVPQYAITYYTIVWRDLDIIKSTAYIAMTIVSNGLIASVTLNVILAGFLALLIAADISLGAYAVYLLAATRPGDDALAGRVTDLVNLICTVLIALKIWRVQREVDWFSPAISALRNGSSSKKSKQAGWFRMRGWMPGDCLILVVVESAQGRPRSRHRRSGRLDKYPACTTATSTLTEPQTILPTAWRYACIDNDSRSIMSVILVHTSCIRIHTVCTHIWKYCQLP